MTELTDLELEQISGGHCESENGAAWLGCQAGYYLVQGIKIWAAIAPYMPV
jgi:bacteriocin-like protein